MSTKEFKKNNNNNNNIAKAKVNVLRYFHKLLVTPNREFERHGGKTVLSGLRLKKEAVKFTFQV
jgi:hypothetical protein